MRPATAAADDAAVICRDVSRSFGTTHALDGFTESFGAGRVTGLVGPNGAGKTTLLLILAGLLEPDGGSVQILGTDPVRSPFDVHRVVGWMPDFFGVYEDLTPAEYLELFAAAYRVPKEDRPSRARDVLSIVGMDRLAGARVHTLSRGQKQALGFARALLHRPAVLLLDEPAAGLDPSARMWLRGVITEQAKDGVTVVLSSHILAELEEMVDAVVFMDRGRSQGSFDRDALPRSSAGTVWRLDSLDPESLRKALRAARVKGRWIDDRRVLVTLRDERAASRLIKRLVGADVPLSEAARQEGDLEHAYLALHGETER